MSALKLRSLEPNETGIKHLIHGWLNGHGIFNFHLMAGIACYKGAPDRIFIVNGVSVYCEIKAANGKQSIYQQEFQRQVERSGGKYLLAKSLEDVIKCVEEIKCQQKNGQ